MNEFSPAAQILIKVARVAPVAPWVAAHPLPAGALRATRSTHQESAPCA
jgi:hypothetical protein